VAGNPITTPLGFAAASPGLAPGARSGGLPRSAQL